MWHVIRQAVAIHLSRPQFIAFTVAVPILIFVFSQFDVLIHTLTPRMLDANAGFVDESGLFTPLPASYQGDVIVFADEAAAQTAYANGAITTYMRIPADFAERGVIYGPTVDTSAPTPGDRLLALYTVTVMMSSDNPAVRAMTDTFLGITRSEARPVYRVVGAVLVLTAFNAASSLTRGKNDASEGVTLYLVGVGAVHTLRVMLWAAALLAFTVLRPSPWMLVYFVLGYALYGALFPVVEGLPPIARWATLLIMSVLVVLSLMPDLLAARLGEGVVPALSWFPLTAPGTMVTRLARGAVPTVDIFISVWVCLLTLPGLLWVGIKRAEAAV